MIVRRAAVMIAVASAHSASRVRRVIALPAAVMIAHRAPIATTVHRGAARATLLVANGLRASRASRVRLAIATASKASRAVLARVLRARALKDRVDRAAKVVARKVAVLLVIAPQVVIGRRGADPLVVASALMVRADLAGIAKPRCALLVAHGAGAH